MYIDVVRQISFQGGPKHSCFTMIPSKCACLFCQMLVTIFSRNSALRGSVIQEFLSRAPRPQGTMCGWELAEDRGPERDKCWIRHFYTFLAFLVSGYLVANVPRSFNYRRPRPTWHTGWAWDVNKTVIKLLQNLSFLKFRPKTIDEAQFVLSLPSLGLNLDLS